MLSTPNGPSQNGGGIFFFAAWSWSVWYRNVAGRTTRLGFRAVRPTRRYGARTRGRRGGEKKTSHARLRRGPTFSPLWRRSRPVLNLHTAITSSILGARGSSSDGRERSLLPFHGTPPAACTWKRRKHIMCGPPHGRYECGVSSHGATGATPPKCGLHTADVDPRMAAPGSAKRAHRRLAFARVPRIARPADPRPATPGDVSRWGSARGPPASSHTAAHRSTKRANHLPMV